MDKKLFELQVRHNYFIRFVIVSICKLVLWSFIFGIIIAGTYMFIPAGLDWAKTGTYNPTKYSQMVISGSAVVVILTLILYIIILVSTIMKIITEHKIISSEEKKHYANIGKMSFETTSSNNIKKHSIEEDEL